MVLVKRRSTFSGASLSTATTRGPHLVPYGVSPENVSPESGARRSFSFDKSKQRSNNGAVTVPSWLYRVIGASVVFWWVGSHYFWSSSRQVTTTSPSKWEDSGTTKLEYSKPGLDNHVPKLEKKLIVDESAAGAYAAAASGEADDSTSRPGIVDRWIEHRMSVLENKVQTLQKYVQEEARKSVIEKFGLGPTYRVKFTVELIRAKAIKSFVVETAPLDLVPHSVHVFLETVAHGLWDNTVFWHHDNVDHVISAATVIYSTGLPNHNYFDALGLRGVSFAEYSAKFPHTKYTMGFANRGPVFYINTLDNTELHGPGGQGHHDFPDEADPCFARVVEGLDVVDEMYKLSVEPKARQGEEEQEWHKYDLTHIVSAEIIDIEYHH